MTLESTTYKHNQQLRCCVSTRQVGRDNRSNVRRSPGLKQCEEDLNNTDDGRLVLLLVKNVRQQLLHSLLSDGDEERFSIHFQSFCAAC